MPIPFTSQPHAPAGLSFGQQSTFASDMGQGYALGDQIGSRMKQRRDQRRQQREMDRIMSRMDMSSGEPPDPRLVQGLATVAGPEFANQWLDVSAKLSGMGDSQRQKEQEQLRQQAMFELSWLEGVSQLPPERRAEAFTVGMEQYLSNPETRDQAMASIQAFMGPAMQGQMPDFSDENIQAMRTRNEYFLNGMKILEDKSAMNRKVGELAQEGANAAALTEQELAGERDARAFEGQQNQLDREAQASIEDKKRQTEVQVANIRSGAQQEQEAGKSPLDVAKERQQEYGGSDGDWFVFLDPSYQEMLQPQYDESGNISGYIGPSGKALDLGRFFQNPGTQLSPDDPLAGGSAGGTVRRTQLPSWLGASEP